MEIDQQLTLFAIHRIAHYLIRSTLIPNAPDAQHASTPAQYA